MDDTAQQNLGGPLPIRAKLIYIMGVLAAADMALCVGEPITLPTYLIVGLSIPAVVFGFKLLGE
jgi:hypothetical protein